MWLPVLLISTEEAYYVPDTITVIFKISLSLQGFVYLLYTFCGIFLIQKHTNLL